jgi:hypothetical protein
MRYKNVVQFGLTTWVQAYGQPLVDGGTPKRVSSPPLLLGRPGIGKTSTGFTLSVAMTDWMQSYIPDAPPALYDALDLSSILPEDMGGIPFREMDEETQIAYTVFAMRKRLAPFCQPGAYGVLILDDITQASNAVQVAARQTVLQMQVGDFTLSEGVYVMVTGNRRSDKSGASTLPAHFRNSCIILSVEPELDEWIDWYAQQGFDPRVPSYLQWKKTNLSKTPSDADEQGAFATPRSWAKLGEILPVAEATGVDLEVARGLVGEGVAINFRAYLNTRAQLVNPSLVLADPDGAMPFPRQMLTDQEKRYAMITGLGEEAGLQRQNAGSAAECTEIGARFMRALAHCTLGSEEFIGVGVTTYSTSGGKALDLVAAGRKYAKDDPRIAVVLEYLVKVAQ